ncbi:hypothetical protein DPEC_G00328800, partial [Dallia pectoralis]
MHGALNGTIAHQSEDRGGRQSLITEPSPNRAQLTMATMAIQVLCVWLILKLQPSLVSMVVVASDGDTSGRENHLEKTKWAKMDFFDPKESPQNAPVPPRRKAPRFMVDLFNAVADSTGISTDTETSEANVVRSFEDRGNIGGRFHFFNLSSFGRDERMVKAEFRWFRQKQLLSFGKTYGPHFYKVDLYEVMDSRVKPWRANLITSRLLPLYTQGWEVFNVTQTVSRWIHSGRERYGILAVVTLQSGKWVESIVPSADEMREENAYLVLFSDDRRGPTTNRSIAQGHVGPKSPEMPAKVSPREGVVSRRERAAPGYHPPGYNTPGYHPPGYQRSPSCQRVPLFVDFEEIGWAGWIISPRGYNAYHCKGSCPFPLGESLRATNHATVQSIMHALKLSDDVDTPCCVPDKLQSISLLYFD